MGVEQDWERRKVMQAQTGKAEVSGVKKASIGGGYVGVLDVLQGGRYQFGSAPTTSIAAVTGGRSPF